MPFLDRPSFLRLLDRLGDQDDRKALEAARTLSQRMRNAGLTWSQVLVAAAAPPADDDDGLGDDLDAPLAGTAEAGDDAARIQQLLAYRELSDDARETLAELQSDLAEGRLRDEDRAYLRSLHARLTGRR